MYGLTVSVCQKNSSLGLAGSEKVSLGVPSLCNGIRESKKGGIRESIVETRVRKCLGFLLQILCLTFKSDGCIMLNRCMN